ncbi:MAG: hypothetical protein VB035_04340 [Candidatus Fimivivens sp.]|nr:hypothetical protein [Candidatus Fimivivens sp.]
MIDYGRTRSTVKPEPLKIDEFSVWVCSNITPIVETDPDGEREFNGFEFDMVQYDKDEYIRMMDAKTALVEQQLTDTQLALVEVYEMMI